MAKTRSEFWIVGIMTVIVTVMFFLNSLFVGAALGTSFLAAITMGLLTAVMGMASYRYRGYLQRKAFTGKKQADESLSSQQERSIEIDLPYHLAFDLAHEALQTLHRQDVPQPDADNLLLRMETWVPRKQLLRIHKEDREAGIIQAGLRSKVFGLDNVLDFSQIDMELEQIDPTTTRIVIASKPAQLNEYFDLGKNLHYVNSLARYIRRESHQMNAEARLLDSADERDELSDADAKEDYRRSGE
jgi:hypothetical protein